MFYLKYRISFFVFPIEDLSSNGTPSQSSDFYWAPARLYMTADLAISGRNEDTFQEYACSLTMLTDQAVAWWMLTFPVDTVFISNVEIYYRSDGKSTYKCIWLF